MRHGVPSPGRLTVAVCLRVAIFFGGLMLAITGARDCNQAPRGAATCADVHR